MLTGSSCINTPFFPCRLKSQLSKSSKPKISQLYFHRSANWLMCCFLCVNVFIHLFLILPEVISVFKILKWEERKRKSCTLCYLVDSLRNKMPLHQINSFYLHYNLESVNSLIFLIDSIVQPFIFHFYYSYLHSFIKQLINQKYLRPF